MRTGTLPGRIAALALLAAVVGTLYAAVGHPLWRAYQSNRDAIAEHREKIARFARVAAELEPLRETLRELERDDRLRRFVLEGPSPALAAAGLQERVKAIVERAGGRLTSTQALPPVAEGRFRRIDVNVRMAVEVEALQRVLHELETAVPVLIVDDVRILARRVRVARRNRNPALPAARSDLDVRFRLSGYLAAPSPSATAPAAG